ncbi:hypothetical protein EVAR_65258_1 [Eumeta japonica]|uniref:Uncharacterized protein n=1 Tax=Eumeta variegata TaxID=151549 RepID=A0A4C1ZYU0_EUMVA|nr:hypothetical protein EVAR_65258_1 [Eumeta japonica]
MVFRLAIVAGGMKDSFLHDHVSRALRRTRPHNRAVVLGPAYNFRSRPTDFANFTFVWIIFAQIGTAQKEKRKKCSSAINVVSQRTCKNVNADTKLPRSLSENGGGKLALKSAPALDRRPRVRGKRTYKSLYKAVTPPTDTGKSYQTFLIVFTRMSVYSEMTSELGKNVDNIGRATMLCHGHRHVTVS